MVVVVVAIFGNDWYRDHVIADAHGNVANRLVRIPAQFPWRTSRFAGATEIVVGEYLGIAVLLAVVFFATWVIARRATGAALFLGTWGVTILAAILGGWIAVAVGYGAVFGNSRDPEGLGRFWYAVFNGGPAAALFGVCLGVLAGGLATLFAGAAARPVAPVMWQPAPAGGGYGGVSLSAMPAYGAPPDDPTAAFPTSDDDPTAVIPTYYGATDAATFERSPYGATSDPTTVLPAQHGASDPTTVLPVEPTAGEPARPAPAHVDWSAPTPPSASQRREPGS
jgi:hypothetical protein